MNPKRSKSRNSGKMPMMHPNAAAIDVGATMHMAAVRADRAPEPVRSFGTFTADLHRLVDWFTECGVETVVMESTSVYWIPVFELLDARGFTVFLVNARDAKHVPGRKTDVSDAQWLQRLHSFGLLRASFRPKGQIAELRAYVRQRERLLEYAASHIQHMQKALTEMNLLTVVELKRHFAPDHDAVVDGVRGVKARIVALEMIAHAGHLFRQFPQSGFEGDARRRLVSFGPLGRIGDQAEQGAAGGREVARAFQHWVCFLPRELRHALGDVVLVEGQPGIGVDRHHLRRDVERLEDRFAAGVTPGQCSFRLTVLRHRALRQRTQGAAARHGR